MRDRALAATLSQMVESIRNFRRYTTGMAFGDYQRDTKTRHAVERCLEIISEAARRLPRSIQERHPELPWREIKGIGNILRHSYEEVDDRVIWSVLESHLTPLEMTLRQIANENGIELRPD